jgi:hypothetical protein
MERVILNLGAQPGSTNRRSKKRPPDKLSRNLVSIETPKAYLLSSVPGSGGRAIGHISRSHVGAIKTAGPS